MMSDDKFNDKVCELINSITDVTNGWKFNSEQIEMIRILNDECDRSGLYEATREQTKAYRAGLTAEQIFMDMVMKVAYAPNMIMAIASVKLLIPEIHDKLLEERNKTEMNRKEDE